MYTIRLSDGTTVKAQGINGNYFVCDEKFDTGIFAGKLNGVTISCDDEDILGVVGSHEHMRLEHEMMFEGKFLFLLLDIPQEEIYRAKLDGNIEYLAMMTGVEL